MGDEAREGNEGRFPEGRVYRGPFDPKYSPEAVFDFTFDAALSEFDRAMLHYFGISGGKNPLKDSE